MSAQIIQTAIHCHSLARVSPHASWRNTIVLSVCNNILAFKSTGRYMVCCPIIVKSSFTYITPLVMHGTMISTGICSAYIFTFMVKIISMFTTRNSIHVHAQSDLRTISHQMESSVASLCHVAHGLTPIETQYQESTWTFLSSTIFKSIASDRH